MQKAFSKIYIILIVVVVIAAGVLVYQQLQKPTDQTQPPADQELTPADEQPADEQLSAQEPTDQTANWQTYRNEEYGFELKYPDNWKMTGEARGSGEGVLSLYSVNIQKGEQAPPGIHWGRPGIIINVFNKDYFKGVGPSLDTNQEAKSYWDFGEDVTIGEESYSGRKVFFRDKHYIESFFYLLCNGNYDYEIVPSVKRLGGVEVNLKEEIDNSIPEFYQILSTFKFID